MIDRDTGEPVPICDILVGAAVKKFQEKTNHISPTTGRVEPYLLADATDDAIREAVEERSLSAKDVLSALKEEGGIKPRDIKLSLALGRKDGWEEFDQALGSLILHEIVIRKKPELEIENRFRNMRREPAPIT